jgi:hypothetical protein
MLSAIKTMWPPAADDPRQGYKRRIEVRMERDVPLVEPMRTIHDPMWWTSCHISCALDPTAHFTVSLMSGPNGLPLETWIQPAGTLQPLTWPIPGDLANYLDLHLVVRYMGNCELTAACLTLGFHELEPFPNPEMDPEDQRYIFVNQTGQPRMLWDAAQGVGATRGSDYLADGQVYIVVPPSHRLLGDRQWWDMRHVVHSWNDVLPR